MRIPATISLGRLSAALIASIGLSCGGSAWAASPEPSPAGQAFGLEDGGNDKKPGNEPDAIPPPSASPHDPAKSADKGLPEPGSLEQRDQALESLYGQLAAAGSAQEAEPIAKSIERLWHYSGSATADLLAERAIAAAKADRRDLALNLLDSAVELQPDYAEAWNRRAYVHYLNNDTKRALGDLRRVLALEPKHFKALEGLARIMREVGDKKAAYEAFKQLIVIYPQSPGAKEALEELRLEVEGQGI